ncbi:unnamed protein product [Chrysoparadoxa australica]
MSCIGIDLGSDACYIATVKGGGVEAILNENSQRRNPCLVSVQGTQRMMGEAALSIARSNYKNTVTQVKRLIGRVWGDPTLEVDRSRVMFDIVQHPDNDGVGIKLNYDGENKVFSPEQVVAMMLSKLMDIAAAATPGVGVAEAVVSIPGWYTDSMRRAMLDACQIVGLNCLRLMHESTAVALAYGIYKSAKGLFVADKPQNIMFIDMGHSGFSSTVCSFLPGKLVVKSSCYDRDLGGRDFDWAIAQHLADEFKAKTGLDPRGKPKSMLKLLGACEKAKKDLSPVGVTECAVNIEYLVDEVDFHTHLKLTTFEEIVSGLVDRMEKPITQALKEAGLTREELGSVEVVGGGSRVQSVRRRLADLLGTDKEAINCGLSTTLNADECVARGCALQCAMLSSRFKVKDFNITEAVPYPVAVSWESSDAAASNGMDEDEEEQDPVTQGTGMVLFEKGDPSPATKRITLPRSEPFTVKATYADSAELPPNSRVSVGQFKVNVACPDKSQPQKVRVNIRHDVNGILTVQSAQMMVPIEESAATAEAPAAPAEKAPDNMDVDGEENSTAPAEGEKTADGTEPPAEDKSAAPDKAQRKFRKVDLSVLTETTAWSKEQMDAAVEAEAKMAQADRILRETAEKRNELETYIYATRDSLGSSLKPFVTEESAGAFMTQLEEAEEWLYSDEGFDTTKKVYASKLSALQGIGDPIKQRKFESENRERATQGLKVAIDMYRKFATSSDDAYAHIEDSAKDKVKQAVTEAETWLYDGLARQAEIAETADAVITVAQINQRVAKLSEVCRPVMATPKPQPKEDPKKQEEKEEKSDCCSNNTCSKEESKEKEVADKAEAEASKDDAVPMETEGNTEGKQE